MKIPSFVKKFTLSFLVTKIKENPKMNKAIEFMKRKKSYVVLGIAILTGILQSQGIVIPDYVWTIIASLLGVTYKMGMNRAEIATKELIEEIKNVKNDAIRG